MLVTPFAVHAAFALASAATVVLTFGKSYLGGGGGGNEAGDANDAPAETAAFKRFQRTYLAVYLLMMAGDWLQGPYMYALYDAYGFAHEEIAALFVAGFGSSMLFGTFAGSLADTLGRKRGALAYVVVYAASCATKHWRSYNVLMVGRVLGGVATSLLFSVFDAWLVAEHASRGFEPAWLSRTFANAQAGDGVFAFTSTCRGDPRVRAQKMSRFEARKTRRRATRSSRSARASWASGPRASRRSASGRRARTRRATRAAAGPTARSWSAATARRSTSRPRSSSSAASPSS